MISMYAEYSGRTLYVALSSDTIEGAKNGDTLYEMDTGKRYVYNESNDAWDEQPEEGGGGGTLITKTITTNGTFAAADDGADGFSGVSVDVQPKEYDLIVTNNLTGSSAALRRAYVYYSRVVGSNPPAYSSHGVSGNGNTTTCQIPGFVNSGDYIVITTQQSASFVLPTGGL